MEIAETPFLQDRTRRSTNRKLLSFQVGPFRVLATSNPAVALKRESCPEASRQGSVVGGNSGAPQLGNTRLEQLSILELSRPVVNSMLSNCCDFLDKVEMFAMKCCNGGVGSKIKRR